MIRFLLQVTDYSRQQLTRLINQYLKTGVVQLNKVHKPPGFKQKYGATDVALLAEMDERYDTPSGAVIKKLCERAYCIFNEDDYQNIANISVSHLYNLRHSAGYQKQRRKPLIKPSLGRLTLAKDVNQKQKVSLAISV